MKFPTRSALDGLRGREIKKLLIDLNVPYERFSKIIDREELKDLAYSVIESQQQKEKDVHFYETSKRVVGIVGIFAISLLCAVIFRKQIRNYLYQVDYEFKKHLAVLKIAWKQKLVIAFLLTCLGMILLVFGYLLRIRIFLSWFLSSSTIDSYIKLPLLSFPVGSNRLSSYSSSFDHSTNYSIDIGPMLMLYAVNYIQSSIENYAYKIILSHQHVNE